MDESHRGRFAAWTRKSKTSAAGRAITTDWSMTGMTKLLSSEILVWDVVLGNRRSRCNAGAQPGAGDTRRGSGFGGRGDAALVRLRRAVEVLNHLDVGPDDTHLVVGHPDLRAVRDRQRPRL